MSMSLPTTPRYAFIIRIWFELEPNLKGYAPAMRGSLQQIGTEHVQYFHTFGQLIEHLEQLTEAQKPDRFLED